MTSTPADLPMPAPQLKTDIVRVGDAVVCILSGDLHAGTQAVGERALGEALEGRPALLVVDMDAVELFTADGLNLLLSLQETARTRNVPVVVVSPSAAVRRVLDVTGATETFTVYSTVAEATGRYRP
ncbi:MULTISPECIES: STAS domain-containing protein [unclassified Streptomyces]|uniref:STAS domain-containing protein n=2 Tax=Streptomyces TaxID=1883 RepID=UPI00099C057B|nr:MULTISPECIES: STAS domain-containing protein [unclassified Streptomyces]QNE29607.1 STAS domain-containing protein [Streptomyces sp. INR7]